ncbi:hypothetical protein VPNG_01569 [Cytospora leucostoma]|uniref:Uncharacterized protein n=1 Tax=Cytospora leucostoma TaxID=1230097 RepID=A0A423XK43_9PEZI|nr:hypothetical protein VPNG_01569 [Cytospora leucostoma]
MSPLVRRCASLSLPQPGDVLIITWNWAGILLSGPRAPAVLKPAGGDQGDQGEKGEGVPMEVLEAMVEAMVKERVEREIAAREAVRPRLRRERPSWMDPE